MKNKDFKPYIPPENITTELSLASVLTGIVLAIVFGAANAYLGLRVGMTVSASIPAAVIAMGVIRIVMKRNSILESNMVQTIGSAGESVAAGAIFTLPALFLWAAEGKTGKPEIIEITLITLLGGLLGIFFMVPLRNALIVKEHYILPYPEGTACAEVLLAGENEGKNASVVFAGMGISAIFKFVIDGLKLVAGEISLTFKGYAGEFGTQIYPAVLGVGYICGSRIASYMFSGGVLSWLVIIPLMVLFGSESVLYPASETVGELFASGGASALWGTYIRYIGAGALASGGIISLIKSLPLIVKTFGGTVKSVKDSTFTSDKRTEQDINIKYVISALIILTVLVWLIPAIPVSFLGAIIVVVFGFFFATVSSRMVGLVGSSNNPVSGMSIATLLVSALILKYTNNSGISGMISALSIGSIICIVSAISGDTSQDLKTGFLLGATPKKQQIGEIIGVTAASVAIGGTLYILDRAWGFGSEELAAPQATLMKMIIEGVMDNSLPWPLVFTGVFITIFAEILRVPVLPIAIGVYLPIHLNACIMAGGIVRLCLDRLNKENAVKKEIINNGILFSSGMIAGEGLIGIMLALFAVFGLSNLIDISLYIPQSLYNGGSVIVFGLIILCLLKFSLWKRSGK